MAKYSECDVHRGGPKEASCPKCMSVIDDSFSPEVQGDPLTKEDADKLGYARKLDDDDKAATQKAIAEAEARELGFPPGEDAKRMARVLAGLARPYETPSEAVERLIRERDLAVTKLDLLFKGGRPLLVKVPADKEVGSTAREYRMVLPVGARYLVVHKLEHLDHYSMNKIHKEFVERYGESVVNFFTNSQTEITVLELPKGD